MSFEAMIQQQANAQNAFNERMADKTNAFNAAQADKTNAFNAQQAQLDRDFQERMSNTAIQRKMQDASAAGLNPYFAQGMQGAQGVSGAQASGAQASANSTPQAADIINALTSYTTAQMHAQAQIQAASMQAGATMAAANAQAAASRYAADKQSSWQTHRTNKEYKGNVVTKGVKASGVAYANNQKTVDKATNSIGKTLTGWWSSAVKKYGKTGYDR